MSTIEVKFDDVVKLILQFLKQNQFDDSFHALQKQSNISLNTIDKITLSNIIKNQQWDSLLKQMNYLMPSQQTLFDLYEMIIDDLIETDRIQAAQFLIKKLLVHNKSFQTNYKERILRLQYICENRNQKALYKKPVTDSRKETLIKRLIRQTHQEVENGRLLTLLTQAIKHQYEDGLLKPNISLSLYENKQRQLEVESQEIIRSVEKIVKYSEQSKISIIRISNKGEYVGLAGIDGLIEIYDPIQYALHTGLSYQAQDIMMYHDDPVCCLEFNETDELLASADIKGCVKIWNMESGKLLRKFNYTSNVGCICWGNDPSHLLVAYQGISLYGIRSCTVLKEYNSQQTQYLLTIYVNNQRLYAFGQSGTIRIFNYSTQEQINTHSLKLPIFKVCPIVSSTDIVTFTICTPKYITCLGSHLEEETKFTVIDGQFLTMGCIGSFVYECILTHDKKYKMNVRDRKNGKIVHFRALDERIDSFAIGKFRNLLIAYDESHSLQFWRP